MEGRGLSSRPLGSVAAASASLRSPAGPWAGPWRRGAEPSGGSGV